MNSASKLFDIYNSRREELVHLSERQLRVVQALDLDQYCVSGAKPSELLGNLAARLREENLRVLVMGEFSAGKSTLINALLGARILPAKALPTTAVISEVRYAPEDGKRIMMFPRPGLWEKGDSPFPIRLDELSAYTSIEHRGKDGKVNRSPFQKAEIYWPLALCRNGVELVDSPGLNDPDSHDEITLSYSSAADAIVYCISSIHACTRLDMDTLDMLWNMGYKSILFVLTYYDRILESAITNNSREDEEFRRDVTNRLVALTELGKEGMFFVDSLSALKGKTSGDGPLYHDSGIPVLEERLQSYLVQQRGQAKLIKAINTIRGMNAQASRELDSLSALFGVSLEELETRYKDAERPLEDLRQRGELICAKVDSGLKDVLGRTESLARLFLLDCPDMVPAWIEEFAPINKVSMNPIKIRESVELIADEYIAQVKLKMSSAGAAWADTKLNPLIRSGVESVFRDLGQKTKEYDTKLSDIRLKLEFDPKTTGSAVAKEQQPSTVSRLGGIAYGILTQDWINAGMTSVFGFKGLVRSLTMQVVAGVVLGIASVFTPVGAPAFIIGAIVAGCAGAGWSFLSISDTIRERVVNACQAALRDSSQQAAISGEIVGTVREELQQISNGVANAFREDTAQLEGQVRRVIAEKKESTEQIRLRQLSLESIRKENAEIASTYFEIAMEAGA